MSDQGNKQPLALPPPSADSPGAVPTLEANGSGESLKFDQLGPLVVNSDGVSRTFTKLNTVDANDQMKDTIENSELGKYDRRRTGTYNKSALDP